MIEIAVLLPTGMRSAKSASSTPNQMQKRWCTGHELSMMNAEVGAVTRIGMFLWGGVDDTIQEKNMKIGM